MINLSNIQFLSTYEILNIFSNKKYSIEFISNQIPIQFLTFFCNKISQPNAHTKGQHKM